MAAEPDLTDEFFVFHAPPHVTAQPPPPPPAPIPVSIPSHFAVPPPAPFDYRPDITQFAPVQYSQPIPQHLLAAQHSHSHQPHGPSHGSDRPASVLLRPESVRPYLSQNRLLATPIADFSSNSTLSTSFASYLTSEFLKKSQSPYPVASPVYTARGSGSRTARNAALPRRPKRVGSRLPTNKPLPPADTRWHHQLLPPADPPIDDGTFPYPLPPVLPPDAVGIPQPPNPPLRLQLYGSASNDDGGGDSGGAGDGDDDPLTRELPTYRHRPSTTLNSLDPFPQRPASGFGDLKTQAVAISFGQTHPKSSASVIAGSTNRIKHRSTQRARHHTEPVVDLNGMRPGERRDALRTFSAFQSAAPPPPPANTTSRAPLSPRSLAAFHSGVSPTIGAIIRDNPLDPVVTAYLVPSTRRAAVANATQASLSTSAAAAMLLSAPVASSRSGHTTTAPPSHLLPATFLFGPHASRQVKDATPAAAKPLSAPAAAKPLSAPAAAKPLSAPLSPPPAAATNGATVPVDRAEERKLLRQHIHAAVRTPLSLTFDLVSVHDKYKSHHSKLLSDHRFLREMAREKKAYEAETARIEAERSRVERARLAVETEAKAKRERELVRVRARQAERDRLADEHERLRIEQLQHELQQKLQREAALAAAEMEEKLPAPHSAGVVPDSAATDSTPPSADVIPEPSTLTVPAPPAALARAPSPLPPPRPVSREAAAHDAGPPPAGIMIESAPTTEPAAVADVKTNDTTAADEQYDPPSTNGVDEQRDAVSTVGGGSVGSVARETAKREADRVRKEKRRLLQLHRMELAEAAERKQQQQLAEEKERAEAAVAERGFVTLFVSGSTSSAAVTETDRANVDLLFAECGILTARHIRAVLRAVATRPPTAETKRIEATHQRKGSMIPDLKTMEQRVSAVRREHARFSAVVSHVHEIIYPATVADGAEAVPPKAGLLPVKELLELTFEDTTIVSGGSDLPVPTRRFTQNLSSIATVLSQARVFRKAGVTGSGVVLAAGEVDSERVLSIDDIRGALPPVSESTAPDYTNRVRVVLRTVKSLIVHGTPGFDTSAEFTTAMRLCGAPVAVTDDESDFYSVLDDAALRDVIHHFVVTEHRRGQKLKKRVHAQRDLQSLYPGM